MFGHRQSLVSNDWRCVIGLKSLHLGKVATSFTMFAPRNDRKRGHSEAKAEESLANAKMK